MQQFLGLSKIPHYTTLQKASARPNHGMLVRILESFVVQARIKNMIAGIDSNGFSHGQSSYYYTKKAKLRRKFVKVSMCADMRRQLVCSIRVRHRWRHDSVDFVPLVQHAASLVRTGAVVADRGYDSEDNHVESENLGIQNAMIRPKHESLPVYRTKGYHRKQMKRRLYWKTYHHRNKAETIFSVIKRIIGECVMSRTILTQNREIMYRVMAYNCYGITRNSLLIMGVFFHTKFFLIPRPFTGVRC